MTHDTLIPLLRDLAPVGRPVDYRRSLAELGKLTPNPWLPLTPAYGQNANVYNRAWHDVRAANADIVR